MKEMNKSENENIVKIYDCIESENQKYIYIVLEYCKDGTLH